MLVNAEVGFTSDVIKDPKRFVGRTDLIQKCITSLNSPLSLIAIFGKRGVGKSSLLRQIQQMANGDYSIATHAGQHHLIPKNPRRYYTVYYQCDSIITDAAGLLARLCNDHDSEDGLLRLVPDKGKELVEFSRADEAKSSIDLKLLKWGVGGTDVAKYSSTVPGDIVQTFRNFVGSILEANNKVWSKRDGVLILLDEFDVIQNKDGLGSLIKSMSSERVKFAVCGIARDLTDLVHDHKSVERLLEEGSLYVKPMNKKEISEIFRNAERLFDGKVSFDDEVVSEIAVLSDGYPYFAQLLGKECVNQCNRYGDHRVTKKVLDDVLSQIKIGKAFPTLEQQYQRAIGDSVPRQLLLTLLAEQKDDVAGFNDDFQKVVLQQVRRVAQDFQIEHIDQLVPRLIEKKYGPVLVRVPDAQGLYEFENPVLRAYIRLRNL